MAGMALTPTTSETLARALVMRLMQIRAGGGGRVSPLPKWRLKRVPDHIDAHISEAISLSDLADGQPGCRGCIFAAQFRLATGFKPHDFILAAEDRGGQASAHSTPPMTWWRSR